MSEGRNLARSRSGNSWCLNQSWSWVPSFLWRDAAINFRGMGGRTRRTTASMRAWRFMSNSLEFLVRHGSAVLFAAVLFEQLGIPLPSAPWLLAPCALDGTG